MDCTLKTKQLKSIAQQAIKSMSQTPRANATFYLTSCGKRLLWPARYYWKFLKLQVERK
jgi:hypothetical protein